MKKACAICRDFFSPHKNAKTADTRTLCFACRKAMKEARIRERGLTVDVYGRRGNGWRRLQPL